MKMRTSQIATSLVVLALLGISTVFQNCAKMEFASDPNATNLSSQSGSEAGNTGSTPNGNTNNPGNPTAPVVPFSMSDFAVSGSFNMPIEFNYPNTGADKNLKASFSSTAPVSKVVTKKGTFELIEMMSLKIRFTPVFGFRGQEFLPVTFQNSNGETAVTQLTVTVGNNLNHLQPAFAVRSSACITCHAKVSSNYITDFGYGGDGKGRDYYFGRNAPATHPWNGGSIYGDHGANKVNDNGSFATMDFLNPSAKVMVPAAPVTDGPMLEFGQTTLANYVRNRLAVSSSTISRTIQVVEKSKIYIGAPTADRIVAAFQFQSTDGKMKFFKEESTSPELSGIIESGGIFRNSGVVTCEGDLAIRGSLYLENLQLKSKTGCRLYVTESVFMYGPITYLEKTSATNLQISSARAISMGLGTEKKNGVHCEPANGWYPTSNLDSSLHHRYQSLWTIPSHFLRENKTPLELATDVYNDGLKVQSAVGTLYDASCRAETRSVAFERILLNAPQVQSRYQGNIKGIIIAEFALMSLGNFNFEFDPVFTTQTVFPLLKESDFLVVE